MSTPELWLVAGPNGAGKTTLTQAMPIRGLLPDAFLLNPDDRALEILRRQGIENVTGVPEHILRSAFATAADEVLAELTERLARG